MPPRETQLRLYGSRSERESPSWSWVEEQIAASGTYWVDARTTGRPHPRPVWGVWHDRRLHLSVGSPVLLRTLRSDPVVTVHLDSGTDVVIVEGMAVATAAPPGPVIEEYDRKYDWHYDVAQYGLLTTVRPAKVLAWRTAGWAGRDSFRTTGCWVFDAPEQDPSAPG